MLDDHNSNGATRRRFLGAATGFLGAAPLGGLGLLSNSAWAETIDLRAKGGPSQRPLTTSFPEKGRMWESIRGRMAVVHLAVLKDVDEGRLDRVNLTLAALLFVSPWMMGYTDLTIAAQAAWISALVVAIVSAAATTLHFSEWEEWVNFLAGAWIIAAPWILHFHEFGDAVAGFVCIGMIITTIALSELWEVHHPGHKPI